MFIATLFINQNIAEITWLFLFWPGHESQNNDTVLTVNLSSTIVKYLIKVVHI